MPDFDPERINKLADLNADTRFALRSPFFDLERIKRAAQQPRKDLYQLVRVAGNLRQISAVVATNLDVFKRETIGVREQFACQLNAAIHDCGDIGHLFRNTMAASKIQ